CAESTTGTSSSSSHHPPAESVAEFPSQTWAVFSQQKDAKQELFRVVFSGPPDSLANWELVCERLGGASARTKGVDNQGQQVPFPVFIPSRGRPEKAHLNWEADHVFGRPKVDTPLGFRPVVCIVVEPCEQETYREAWPQALMMVLPRSDRGPGYARWVIQKVCTKAVVVSDQPRIRRLSKVWVVDDSLSTFYKLEFLEGQENLAPCKKGSKAKRIKRRVVSNGRPIFLEAMLAVQRHPFLERAAVAGFLRDDGTAVCKRKDWNLDEMALYKVVLLNLNELRRLGAEYLPDLQVYEDIYLNHEVLSLGGRTLKCQSYCFRAVQGKKGGCHEQRSEQDGFSSFQTQLKHLVKPSSFKSLSQVRQQAVMELLQWVQDKEKHCQKVVATRATKSAAELDSGAEGRCKPWCTNGRVLCLENTVFQVCFTMF
ncbi:unnamed protein product, partial [Polarella glacialis]